MEILQNKAYYPYFMSSYMYNVLIGGAGSGKSYACADDMVKRCAERKRRYIAGRKVGATIVRSTWPLVLSRVDAMGLTKYIDQNKQEKTITFANGSQIFFIGLDDSDKLKSIFDPTDAWMEEADQFAQSDFEEIDRRIRSGTDNKITLSLNPVSQYSWIKSYFFDNNFVGDKLLSIKTTYKDNEVLRRVNPAAWQKQSDTLERLKDTNPSAYRVYALGEWGIIEGVVFTNWDEQDPPAGLKPEGYGLDFGYASDPSALIAVYNSGDDIWLDELIYQSGLTNPQLSSLMQSSGIDPYGEIIADCAEPKSIEELAIMGWYAIKPAMKGPDSVRNGIGMMQSKRIHISKRSYNLKKEFSSYSWSKDRNGRELPVPVDLWNHGIDAARYSIQTRGLDAGVGGCY